MRDLRVALVTIQLDDSAVASKYVNMEVEVVIQPSGARTSSESRGTASVH
jgi:hypothetical protein